jgi:hypothetical protein
MQNPTRFSVSILNIVKITNEEGNDTKFAGAL